VTRLWGGGAGSECKARVSVSSVGEGNCGVGGKG
jgi:hypothetical protein